jgi:GT2 family glycosyltransferase
VTQIPDTPAAAGDLGNVPFRGVERPVHRISAAVVNHNTARDLERCLQSLGAAGAAPVVVVDVASTDGSADMVRRRFPDVTLLVSRENRGYGTAANRAIAACQTPYVLLLNSDTIVPPAALETLSDHLDAHPRAAVVGPRLQNPDGTLQRSAHAFPRPATLRPLVRHIPGVSERSLLTWAHDHVRIVPWVKGAALAIRRNAFNAVGGFDARFFMYFEETDLCFRLRTAGWETHYTPGVTIVHAGGASTEQHRADMMVQFYASMRQFYRHHYPRWQLAALDALLVGHTLFRWVRDRARLWQSRDQAAAIRLEADLAAWRRLLGFTWFRT